MCFSVEISQTRAVPKSSNSGCSPPCSSGYFICFWESQLPRLLTLHKSNLNMLPWFLCFLHSVQLNFFRKGFKSLEAVDSHVRLVAERQHIDYQFSGLEDNDGEDGEDSYYANEAGELSFDYRDNKQGLDVVSTSRKSMEVRTYCH